MNLHRNVQIDLASLVAAGRASPESQALVRDLIAEDPQLAELAGDDSKLRALELRALDATRARLRLRGWLMGAAIFLSLLPLSVRGGADGTRFLFAEQPGVQVLMWLVALACWAGWWHLGRSVFRDAPGR